MKKKKNKIPQNSKDQTSNKEFYNKISDDGSIMIMGHPRFSSYLIPFLDEKFS